MKRKKRLERKTELKRGKPLRRKSLKRQRLERQVKPDRDDFRASGDYCEACGEVRQDLCVHEICKGIHREKALKHRGCQLRVCEKCNLFALNDYSKWPLERQLARVLVNRPEDFDLDLVNAVRGRAATAITIRDLAPWLRAL